MNDTEHDKIKQPQPYDGIVKDITIVRLFLENSIRNLRTEDDVTEPAFERIISYIHKLRQYQDLHMCTGRLVHDFKFQPFTYVLIKHLDLDAKGRIVRILWDGAFKMYDVDYCVNGELRRREFYEDELEVLK